MTALSLNYSIYRCMLESSEIVVELMLDNGLHHFLRRDVKWIRTHPPVVETSDPLRMIECNDLQQASCNQGDVHKRFNRIHRPGDQPLGSLIHALQLLQVQRFAFGFTPDRGPEVIAKSSHDMLEHLEGNLDFEPARVQFDNFLRGHRQIGADQNERVHAVFYQHEPQLLFDRLPNEVQTKNIEGLHLAINAYLQGQKVLCTGRKKLPELQSLTVLRSAAATAVSFGLFLIGDNVILGAGCVGHF